MSNLWFFGFPTVLGIELWFLSFASLWLPKWHRPCIGVSLERRDELQTVIIPTYKWAMPIIYKGFKRLRLDKMMLYGPEKEFRIQVVVTDPRPVKRGSHKLRNSA